MSGTLEVGKLAEIVVLDRNPLLPDGGPIGEARVVLTLVGGEAVFEDPAVEG